VPGACCWGREIAKAVWSVLVCGKQIIYYNIQSKIVATRLGEYATIKYDYNDWFAMILASLKNPDLRGKPEDWVAYEVEDEKHWRELELTKPLEFFAQPEAQAEAPAQL